MRGSGIARAEESHSDLDKPRIRSCTVRGSKASTESSSRVGADVRGGRLGLIGLLTKILLGTDELVEPVSISAELARALPFLSTPFEPFTPLVVMLLFSPRAVTAGRAVRSLELELVELDRDLGVCLGVGEVARRRESGEDVEGRMPEFAGDEGFERGFVCIERR